MTSEFIVEQWSADGPQLTLRYRSGGDSFSELVNFPFDIQPTDVVSRLIDLLAIVSGVSYAKAVAPTTVSFPGLDISDAGYALVCQTYNEGMREFAFHNAFPLTSTFQIVDQPRGGNHQREYLRSDPGKPLIPFGAGRDSCVVASALRHLQPTLFTIGVNTYAQQVANQLSLPLITAQRILDPALLTMNAAGAPNGHIPVTAINSLISIIAAEISDHSSVVMANEKSASQPTRIVDGIEVNHQFSKSLEYEIALRAAVDMAGSFISYESVLRYANDHDISHAFATQCTELHPLFMSCNQAMLRDASKRSDGWCGHCPKCRGMYLSLAPHMTPQKLSHIFGQDLLADSAQFPGFLELLSDDTKPFECVASVSEARHSMNQLLISPVWKHHAVVQQCHDAARHTSKQIDTSDESLYESEISRIVSKFLSGQL